MMNIVALCLVLTTLATAGVWSPTPEKVNNDKEDVILKEGHRTVVVEFEKDDGNTKVSISPQEAVHEGFVHKPSSSRVDEKGPHDSSIKGKVSDSVENVKENLKDEQEEAGDPHKATPRELVCDALGRCKHKIASAIGKTKEMVSENAHEAADKVYEVEEEAKEAVTDAYDKVKGTVERKAHEASDKAHEAKERAKDAARDKAHEVKERVKDAASEKACEAEESVKDAATGAASKVKEAKERVKDAANEVSGKAKEKVAEKVHEVKGEVGEAVDTAKTLQGDVEGNLSKLVEATKGKVKEAEENVEGISKEGEEVIERVKEKGKKGFKGILRRGREVVYGFFGYVFSPESLAFGMRILQLLGLAGAYGMSIWVTFISSYVLARALPRQQFAILQSKIYPVYFQAMAYSVGLVLVGHLLSRRKRVSSGAGDTLQGFNLLASLLMLLINLKYLEPLATKVMFESMKLEKEEGRGVEISKEEQSDGVVDSITEPSSVKASSTATKTSPSSSTPHERPEAAASQCEIVRLSEALRKLNTISSFLNVLTLMALTWHLVHLGQLLSRI
nr:uncharacterized protein LOC113712189 [Coffea arabica]